MNLTESNHKRVTMLTTDQKLDRRITLEASSLCKAGYRVTILAMPWEDEDEDFSQEPFEVIRLGNSRNQQNLSANHRAYNGLYKIYRAINGPSILQNVYANFIKALFRSYVLDLEKYYTNLFLDTALRQSCGVYHIHDLQPLAVGALCAAKTGATVIYDSHELFIEQEFIPSEKSCWEKIEQKFIQTPKRVITVNDSIADELHQRYAIQRPAVIYNCETRTRRTGTTKLVKENVFSAHGIPKEKLIILYQGGLIANRNLETMVNALKYVQNKRVALIILGKGPIKNRLQKIVVRESLHDRVFFIPAVSQDELIDMTVMADVGLVPYQANCLNTYYCTPNKLYEYIAAGIPILVNNLPELKRVVDTFGNGWTADLNTPKSFANAIDLAFSTERGLIQRRENSTKAFKTLCWEQEEKKLLAVYDEIQNG